MSKGKFNVKIRLLNVDLVKTMSTVWFSQWDFLWHENHIIEKSHYKNTPVDYTHIIMFRLQEREW